MQQEKISQLAVELFELNENALLAPLWKQQKVTGRSSGSDEAGFLSSSRPSLLLHGLDNFDAPSQPEAYAHIEKAQPVAPTFLYGTSGAGKTRTVFEHLSKKKGFYFLAHDFKRNPGSRDLSCLLD